MFASPKYSQFQKKTKHLRSCSLISIQFSPLSCKARISPVWSKDHCTAWLTVGPHEQTDRSSEPFDLEIFNYIDEEYGTVGLKHAWSACEGLTVSETVLTKTLYMPSIGSCWIILDHFGIFSGEVPLKNQNPDPNTGVSWAAFSKYLGILGVPWGFPGEMVL